ncbi:prepilin-type N-terminal cleavage/methylation domain-containing protein [Waltera sp.]|jgi:type IV pilus assembly protein PilA|uniref:type II secretion system protein n=1 Tax=Waltera sp. TaxID=2815806 RepID=UPI00307BDB32
MNKKQKSLTNKGFSLVELIIVIAIMAVLVGVLAPQYIKYVEKSRVSADAQQVEEFTGAMTVLASDVDVTLDSTKTYTVTSDTTGKITISNDLKTIFDSLGSVDTAKNYSYKSTSYKAQAITISLAYDGTAKVWKVTVTGQPNA